jgi:hypothetical protein
MPPRIEQADQQGDGQQQQKGISSLLDSMALAAARQPRIKDAKDKYAFWGSQPVMQFNEEAKVGSDAAVALQSAIRACLQPASILHGSIASMSTASQYLATQHSFHTLSARMPVTMMQVTDGVLSQQLGAAHVLLVLLIPQLNRQTSCRF